jgi:hypothetical protein
MKHVRIQPSAPVSVELLSPESGRSSFDRHGTILHLGLCLALLAVYMAGARFLTLEADESNILLSAYNVFGLAVPQDSGAAYPTVTSGGVFPLVHGLLGLLTTDVFAHRLISVLLGVVFVGATFRLLRRMNVSRPLAMAGAAMSAATPGFLLVGAMAMAEMMATLLLLLGMLQWVGSGRRTVAGAILAGLLFGLSGATRFNAIFVFPAIVLYAFDFEQGWRRRFLYPGLAAASGLLLLVVATKAYLFAAAPQVEGSIGTVTGATVGKDAFSLSRYVLIANDLIPWWVVVAIIGTYVAAGR